MTQTAFSESEERQELRKAVRDFAQSYGPTTSCPLPVKGARPRSCGTPQRNLAMSA
jgi:hypothetical protein